MLIMTYGFSIGLRVHILVQLRRLRPYLASGSVFRVLVGLHYRQYVRVLQLGERINGQGNFRLVVVSEQAVGLVKGDAHGSCRQWYGR